MRKRSWNLPFLATVLLAFLAIKGHAQTADLQQHLQDQYQNKIFVLRGFYSDEFLHYDATGAPVGAPTPGDWTVDGFVLPSDLQVRGQRLEIEAKRLLVVSRNDSFQFYADSQKKRKKADSVRIEVELGAANATDAIDAPFSSIFLTNRDTLGTLVPDYWEPCVSGGLRNDQKYPLCHFSAELLAVPGMVPGTDSHSDSESKQSSSSEMSYVHLYHVGKGVSPPKQTFVPEPQFSEAGRKAGVQGVVTLGLIVDSHGIPQNIRVLKPLGCGLDAEAVRTINTWRFKPAEQEGHEPVAVEIAVEVDFHL